MSRDPSKAEVVIGVLTQHAGPLRAFVAARVPPSEVEDVLQTAAMRAVERAESLQDPASALSWLYTVHRNVVTDSLRALASRERAQSTAPLPVAEPVDELCGCSVAQAQRIHPPYATVLTMVDAGDATLSEVAEALGISVNNATVRLHRARKALREAMLDHCGVQSLRDCLDCRCVAAGCCAA